MEQRVVGPQDGACRYEQEMPNGGLMVCRYSEESRKAMAAFLRRVAAAQSVGASASTDLSTGETTSASRIDGEPAANPLARSLASGECKVTGYGG